MGTDGQLEAKGSLPLTSGQAERRPDPDGDERRLYAELAWTWPIFSSPEHYAEEAMTFVRHIRAHTRREVRTVLHLGCGGGHLDYTLKKFYRITAVDLSEEMLALARELNPEVEYLQGDMRTVRLDRRFDAVVAADAIDYMLDEDDLRAAFRTAIAHLEPGGVFCTYAESTRERFVQNRTDVSTGVRKGVEVTLIDNDYDPDPEDTTYELTLVYLIRRGGQLQVEIDRHLLGVFSLETWPRLLREVGFEAEVIDRGEEVAPDLVGRKPLDTGPGGLYFRLAIPADEELVYDLILDVCTWLHDVRGITGQWPRDPGMAAARGLIEQGNLYLAFREGEAVAMVQLTERDPLWKDRPGSALYLYKLARRSHVAGQGLGQAILEWAEERARKLGKRYLRLECWDENEGLKAYYSGTGFVPAGKSPRDPELARFEKKLYRGSDKDLDRAHE